MKDVIFYGEITNFTVSSYILRLQEAKEEQAHINILANSFGGDPDAGFGMIAQTRQYPHGKMMTVHGAAYSMMAFAALFVNRVEAIEQAQFLFHRVAAFNIEDEQDSTMRNLIVKRNEDFRRAMEQKLNIPAFERISGVTLDELFSMDSRIDVTLNAQQAMEIGLVTKIIELPAQEIETINQGLMAATHGTGHNVMLLDVPTRVTSHSLAMQAMDNIEIQRKRIAEWDEYRDYCPEQVQAGILSGKFMTSADRGALALAAIPKITQTAKQQVMREQEESDEAIIKRLKANLGDDKRQSVNVNLGSNTYSNPAPVSEGLEAMAKRATKNVITTLRL